MLRLGHHDDVRRGVFGHPHRRENVAHGRGAHAACAHPHGAAARERHPRRKIHDEEVGDPPGSLFRPLRLLAGELFGHRRHQGVRQGDEGAACLPPPQQAQRRGQRLLYEGLDAPQYHGDALCRVRHLHHFGLRRLSRLSGAVRCGAARRIHRLLHGDGLARDGGLPAHRNDVARQSVFEPRQRTP